MFKVPNARVCQLLIMMTSPSVAGRAAFVAHLLRHRAESGGPAPSMLPPGEKRINDGTPGGGERDVLSGRRLGAGADVRSTVEAGMIGIVSAVLILLRDTYLVRFDDPPFAAILAEAELEPARDDALLPKRGAAYK